jgi:HD-like signal output (HDOD) protein
MDRLEAFKSIATEAARGELIFPTNVNASLRLQQALDEPDCPIDTAARLVQAEPLLAARTVAIANSVAYNRSGNEITNVRTAVMRLGFQTLRTLVAALIVRQFGNMNTTPELSIKAAQLWEHTAHVAALAQVIAKRITHVDPETSMFAGIMHEIGGFYLLSRAKDYPGLLDGDLEDWVEYGETKIGRCVLKQLSVPDAVTEAVEALWYGFRTQPPVTLGDTLLLANDLAPVASPLQPHVGATVKQPAAAIDFAVGNDTLAGILEESAEEIQSLTAALLA